MIWKGKRNSGRFGNYNAMELGSYGRKRRCKLLMNESNMHMHDDSSNSCTDKLEQRTSSKKASLAITGQYGKHLSCISVMTHCRNIQ